MECEICGCYPDDVAILPIKRKDGCLNTIACLRCAENSGVYCVKHERPHLGFVDDTTACLVCIEELVEKSRGHEAEIFSKLRDGLPKTEWSRLIKWVDSTPFRNITSRPLYMLRAVACLSLRLKKTIPVVMRSIIGSKSVDMIVPLGV